MKYLLPCVKSADVTGSPAPLIKALANVVTVSVFTLLVVEIDTGRASAVAGAD